MTQDFYHLASLLLTLALLSVSVKSLLLLSFTWHDTPALANSQQPHLHCAIPAVPALYVQSPKAVLGNRFIVVELSDVNLIDVDPHYVDAEETAATAEATKKAEAAAALAARKKTQEKLMVSLALIV